MASTPTRVKCDIKRDIVERREYVKEGHWNTCVIRIVIPILVISVPSLVFRNKAQFIFRSIQSSMTLTYV